MSPAVPHRLARAGLALSIAVLFGCAPDQTPTGVRQPNGGASHSLTSNTLTVTNTNDAGAGSLRQAIADAADGDVIEFDAAIAGQTITLTSNVLAIAGKNLTIDGGVSQGITISGNNARRVFFVAVDGSLALYNLTVTGGKAINGTGGGIFSDGPLTIAYSTITGNEVVNVLHTSLGGAVASSGPLTIINSTISGNSTPFDGGAYTGGAVYTATGVHAQIINSTITGNTSIGLKANDKPTIRNSIIANNPQAGSVNCDLNAGADLVDVNVSDETSCGAAGPHMIVADPKLGALANNGGPTQTHNLLVGSPAIDAGTNCSVGDDQRHVSRPQGAQCDIGSVEFNNFVSVTLAIDANGFVDPVTGVATIGGTATCTGATSLTVHIALSEPQRAARVSTTVTGSGESTINCSGSGLWSVKVAALTGAFQNGTATVNATTVNALSGTSSASASRQVKLAWGKK